MDRGFIVLTATADKEPNMDNYVVYVAIDKALKELGLVLDMGYDTADGGIANDYHHPISSYQVTVTIKNGD